MHSLIVADVTHRLCFVAGLLGFLRRPLLRAGALEAASIMNFSSHGALHCVCNDRHAGEFSADRRQSCRACGHAIVSFDAALLDRELSTREIADHVDLLASGAFHARNLEIPKSVTDIYQLHAYLDRKTGPKPRKPPKKPNASVGVSVPGTRAAG